MSVIFLHAFSFVVLVSSFYKHSLSAPVSSVLAAECSGLAHAFVGNMVLICSLYCISRLLCYRNHFVYTFLFCFDSVLADAFIRGSVDCSSIQLSRRIQWLALAFVGDKVIICSLDCIYLIIWRRTQVVDDLLFLFVSVLANVLICGLVNTRIRSMDCVSIHLLLRVQSILGRLERDNMSFHTGNFDKFYIGYHTRVEGSIPLCQLRLIFRMS
mmetsp:Transcript_25842/g.57419  ORF Transcript_25842/g.57419 Transcript_25842/m.57419 type:complete len:213 (-) Transcript_25842:250-888(-)